MYGSAGVRVDTDLGDDGLYSAARTGPAVDLKVCAFGVIQSMHLQSFVPMIDRKTNITPGLPGALTEPPASTEHVHELCHALKSGEKKLPANILCLV